MNERTQENERTTNLDRHSFNCLSSETEFLFFALDFTQYRSIVQTTNKRKPSHGKSLHSTPISIDGSHSHSLDIVDHSIALIDHHSGTSNSFEHNKNVSTSVLPRLLVISMFDSFASLDLASDLSTRSSLSSPSTDHTFFVEFVFDHVDYRLIFDFGQDSRSSNMLHHDKLFHFDQRRTNNR